MKSLLKKITISLLASLVLLLSFAPYLEVNAQTKSATTSTTTAAPVWYNQSFGDWFMKVYDQSNPSEIFGERYTAAQVQWVVYGIWAFIINTAIGPKGGAVVACGMGGLAGVVTGGASSQSSSCLIQALTNLLSIAPNQNNLADQPNQNLWSEVFADRPLSGITYIKNSVQKITSVPTAHAQTTLGFGFTALDPVQKIWSAFRDIAFGLFVVAAVVLAFMIMFRVKISPQVVISVQSAIPKIIVALILVTFSYAIAGLLVDLMYVVIGLISLVLAPTIPQVFPVQNHVYNAVDVFNILTAGKPNGYPNLIGGIFNLLSVYLTPIITLFLVLALVLTFAIGVTGIGLVLAWIPFVILVLIAIWMAIKTMWALFKAFANVILLTIFAPLQLVAGVVIPNFGFGQWFRSYLSNLAVFVVTGILWLLAWVFGLLAWRGFSFQGTQISFTPASNVWPPLLGTSELGTTLLFGGASFALFTMIPKATELVQAFLSGKPFAYGSALGEATAPASFIYGQTVAPVISSLQRETGGAIYALRAGEIRDLLNKVLPGKKTGDIKSGD